MKGLSIFSRKKVKDEKDKHDYVLQNEKDPNSLEPMSAEMTSLKSRLHSKEEEVQILKDMVAQKDEEIKRLKEQLRVRDLKADVLRADIESAWQKFEFFLPIRRPGRSKNETRHEKEPSSAFMGPPLQSQMSKTESDLIGATPSTEVVVKDEDEDEDNSKTAIGSNRV